MNTIIKIITILILVISFVSNIYASNENFYIEKKNNIPKNDEITLQEVEYLNIGNKGVNIIWDFKNIIYTGNITKINYNNIGDSILLRSDDYSKKDLLLYGDTLLLTGTETSSAKIINSKPSIEMFYPFKYGQILTKTFYSSGKVFLKLKFNEAGTSILEGDAIGSIILPDCLISDVIRIHKYNESFITFEGMNKTYQSSNSYDIKFIDDSYYWYAKGIRYPIASKETKSYINYKGEKYIFYEKYYLQDLIEQEITSKNKLLDNKSESTNESQKNIILNINNLIISNDDGIICVEFLPQSGVHEAQLLLCDISGKIYRESTIKNIDYETRSNIILETANLPRIEFLLNIKTDCGQITKKISILK